MKNTELRIDKPGVYDYKINLKDNGSEEHMLLIVKAYTEGDYKISILSDHLVGNTVGRVEVRGVVKNGAKVVIQGMVKIEKDAKNSDSFLSMKMIVLDGISGAIAEPMLEIENNEVKASHSASVGKIDEEQLMYLMSRGLDRQMAVDLIVEGFLGENIN